MTAIQETLDTSFAPHATVDERLDLLGDILNQYTKLEGAIDRGMSPFKVAEIQLWLPTIQSKYWTPNWQLKIWGVTFRTYLDTSKTYGPKDYAVGFRVEEI